MEAIFKIEVLSSGMLLCVEGWGLRIEGYHEHVDVLVDGVDRVRPRRVSRASTYDPQPSTLNPKP